MRYAIVNKKGDVENIVEWDGTTAYKATGTLVKLEDDSQVQIGWQYKNEEFIKPANFNDTHYAVSEPVA